MEKRLYTTRKPEYPLDHNERRRRPDDVHESHNSTWSVDVFDDKLPVAMRLQYVKEFAKTCRSNIAENYEQLAELERQIRHIAKKI